MASDTFLPGVIDKRLLAAYEKARGYMAMEGVTGVSIGRPVRKGKTQRQLGITIHVAQKLREEAVPSQHMLPKEIDGVPVDIVSSRFTPQPGEEP